MTVTTYDVMLACETILKTQVGDPLAYPTIAMDRVYMPRDWPVQEVDVPILKIQKPVDTKESLGKAGIQFTTSASFAILGEVSAKAKPDDESAGEVLAALMMFAREVELAIIGAPVLFGGATQGLVQQLRSVVTQYATRADGKVHRGAFEMTFDFEFYQGTEDFQLPVVSDIDRFHIYADLINVADPSGTYVPPMDYTPTPAPRTDGPDGRIEGEFEVVP